MVAMTPKASHLQYSQEGIILNEERQIIQKNVNKKTVVELAIIFW